MATRVNTKFVVILATVVIALVGGLGFVLYTKVTKGAADYERSAERMLEEGKAAIAAGNIEEGNALLERAANNFYQAKQEDAKNTSYLYRYIEAHEHVVCNDLTQAFNEINALYFGAENIHDTPGATAEERALLYQTLHELSRQGLPVKGRGAKWHIRDRATKWLISHPGDATASRYLTLVDVERVNSNKTSDEERRKIREELVAQIERHPEDPWLRNAAGRYHIGNAVHLYGVLGGGEEWPDEVNKTFFRAYEELNKAVEFAIADEDPAALVESMGLMMSLSSQDTEATAIMIGGRIETARKLHEVLKNKEMRDKLFTTELSQAAVLISGMHQGIEKHPFQGPEYATALAKAVVSDRPDEPAAHALLGSLLSKLREYDEADRAIEAGLKTLAERKKPNALGYVEDIQSRRIMLSTQAEVKIYLAATAKAEQDESGFKQHLKGAAEMVTQLSKAPTGNPEARDAQAHFLRGRIDYAHGRYKEAILRFERANKFYSDRSPTKLELLLHLAETQRRLGNDGKVLETYEQIVQINPKSPHRLNLIHSYINQSKGKKDPLLDKAERHLDNFLGSFPTSLRGIRLKAGLLAKQGDPAAAEALILAQGIEEHPELLGDLTRYKFLQGKSDEAANIIRERLASRPEDSPMDLTLINELLSYLPTRQAKLDELDRLESEGLAPEIASISRTLLTNGRLSMEDELELLAAQEHSPGTRAVRKNLIYNRWNQPELAEQAYAEAVRAEPKHPEVISLRFEVALRDQKWADAERAIDDALGLELDQRPDIAAIADGAFMRARVLGARGAAMERGQARDTMLRDAANAYTKALDSYGNYVEGWIQLAQVQLVQDNHYAAQGSLRQALGLQTRNIKALALMAQAEIATNDEPRALERLEEILRIQPTNNVALNQYASLAQNLGMPGRAIAQRETTRERLPSNTDNRRALALLYASDLSYDRAKEEIDAVIKIEGMTQTNLAVLSQVFLKGEKPDEAIQAVNSYLTDLGDDAVWRDHLLMAQTYELAGQREQADLSYAKAIQLEDKQAASATLAWAQALSVRGEIERAAQIYEELSGDFPENDALKLNAARVFLAAKQYEKAEQLAKSAKQSPERALLLVESAKGQPGQLGVAVQRAREGVKNFSSHLGLRVELGRLLLAIQVRQPEQNRDFEEAQRVAEQLLADHPERVEAQLLMADVHLTRGENDQAISQLEQILKFAPTHIPANERLYTIKITEARTLSQTSIEASQSKAAEALGIASLLLDARPDLSLLHRRAAEAADLAGQSEDAAKYYRAAFDMTKDPQDLASYSLALLNAGRGADARAFLENPEHTSMRADSLTLRALHGRALAMSGAPDLAQNLFTSTLSNSEDPQQRLLLVRQTGLAFEDDPDRAVRIVEGVLGKDLPVAIDAELATLMMRKREYTKAAERLKKYQAEPISDPFGQFQLMSQLAIAQQESDQLEASRKTYEQARQILKDSPGAVPMRQRVHLLNNFAYLLADRLSGYEQDAVKYAREALEQLPANEPDENVALIEDTLGWALFNAGRYEDAIKVLSRSVQKYPLSANLLHLGRAYYESGKTDQAIDFLERARDIASRGDDEKLKAETEKWHRTALDQ